MAPIDRKRKNCCRNIFKREKVQVAALILSIGIRFYPVTLHPIRSIYQQHLED